MGEQMMIEFRGRITGNAEKHFWKKSRKMVQIPFNLVWLVLLAPVLFITIMKELWTFLVAYGIFLLFINLVILIPKGKKERIAATPKLIYVEDGYIGFATDKWRDQRKITDVKVVRDYGEFYDIIFSFGKVSEYFVCQKDLLSEGTLEEFEALFKCKIERIS